MALFLARVFLVVAAITRPTAAVQMPNYAAFLQNVGNPQYCLKVTGTSLVVSLCDLEALEQTFDSRYYSNYASTPGTMKFNINSMYMEIVGASTENGAAIGLRAPTIIGTVNHNWINANQKWQIVNGHWDGPHQLKNANSGMCMTLEGLAVASGNLSTQLVQSTTSQIREQQLRTDLNLERFNRWYLVQRDCVGQQSAPHQTWRVIQYPRFQTSEWTTMLKSVATPTKCFTSLGGQFNNVGLSICSPSDANQHWTFDPVTSGSTAIRIRNKESDDCLIIQVPLCTNTLNGALIVTTPVGCSEWKSILIDPTTQSETSRRVGFQFGSSSGLALTPEDLMTRIWSYTFPTLSSNQLFNYVTPPLYRKPFGSSCLGPLECLSGSCSFTCQPGGINKACQTKFDCASAICANGACM